MKKNLHQSEQLEKILNTHQTDQIEKREDKKEKEKKIMILKE